MRLWPCLLWGHSSDTLTSHEYFFIRPINLRMSLTHLFTGGQLHVHVHLLIILPSITINEPPALSIYLQEKKNRFLNCWGGTAFKCNWSHNDGFHFTLYRMDQRSLAATVKCILVVSSHQAHYVSSTQTDTRLRMYCNRIQLINEL